MNPTRNILLYSSYDYIKAEDPPDDVPGLIRWLQAVLEKVPKEYHDGVVFTFHSDEGTCDVDIVVDYYRPATDEEMTAENENLRIKKEKIEAYEREQYEKLKTKFEP